MNINYTQNSSGTSFSANLKIKKTKTFKSPSKNFDEWMAENIERWERKAHYIGSNNDTITITLGKNDINVYNSEMLKKQNMTATAKVNGIEMKSNDLAYEYIKIDDSMGRYFDNLKEKVDDYLDFIKRFANCEIIKKNR